jgi:tRNA pseudouridine38-40 synthase
MLLGQPSASRESIHSRHYEIYHCDVRSVFVPGLKRTAAILGFTYDGPIPGPLEYGSKVSSHHRIVLDQEYTNHTAPSSTVTERWERPPAELVYLLKLRSIYRLKSCKTIQSEPYETLNYGPVFTSAITGCSGCWLLRDFMRNLKLMLSYDGSEFAGWQIQPDSPTIQGTLSAAVGRITGETVLPQGSGRTDAGVHALAQVATFATESSVPTGNFVKALNDILPSSIRIIDVQEVAAEFHARKSARSKTYRYRICREAICSPFLARYVWHYPYPLDERAMIGTADLVVGEHDFTSFAAVDPERGRDMPVSNVRRILSSNWERQGDELVYTVKGSGFLHHMVRNLVGTFILVGKGTLKAEDMARILEARNRSAAGATSPASGLCLVSVEY